MNSTVETRPVLGGFYGITEDGRLYSVRNQKFLRPALDKYGYLYYVVSIDSVRTTAKAHRLVAQAFIPNPYEKPTVNHKNGIRTDNRVSNLEWATEKEQAHNPITRQRVLSVAGKTDYRAMGARRNYGRKRVAVYNGSTLLGLYASLKIATETHQANYTNASECANGNRKTAGGVSFVYVG